MAYTTIKQGNQQDSYYIEYVCDTLADLTTLPTSRKLVKPGSAAIIIETGDVALLNTKGEWVII